MDRDEAAALVAPHTVVIRGATSVRHEDARTLLGDERFVRLLADPIRKHGPEPGYVYAWNVTDYIQHPDLRKKEVPSDRITCFDCRGDKKLLAMFPVYAEHVPAEDRKPFVEMDCPRCKGEGTVPAAALQWIEQGRDLTAERKKSGKALREFCIENSIDPLVRSHRERGVIDPATPDVPYDWPMADGEE